jgi:hypothetical protein
MDALKRVDFTDAREWREVALTPEKIDHFKALALQRSVKPNSDLQIFYGKVVNNTGMTVFRKGEVNWGIPNRSQKDIDSFRG